MKCPACKKQVPDDALKCPYCEARVGAVCDCCRTVNSVLDFKCKKCGHEILKQCPNCKAVNFPDALKCRKCGYDFNPSLEEPLYRPNLVSQKSAKNIIVRGILSKDKKIFSLSGEKGVGKSLVLKTVIQELKDYSWFCGKCTPITQLTSAGLIQDILLNVFNLPNFCLNNAQFKKDISIFFKNEFPDFSSAEISELINFLYPEKIGVFEDLSENKRKTFELLNKVFDTLTADKKFVIVIDNFDFIDGFSYEFINKYIKNIWNNLKLLLVYNDPKPAKGYFYYPQKDSENAYLDVGIAPFEFKQIYTLLEQKKKLEGFPSFDTRQLQEIYTIGRGNPSFISQALNLCFDCQLCDEKIELNPHFSNLLESRLSLLSRINPEAYEVLIVAAIIGDKINLNLIKGIFELEDKPFFEIMIYLKKTGYINSINEVYCEFNSLQLWETILKVSKSYCERVSGKVFESLKGFTLNANAVFAIITQNMKQPDLALAIWTKNTRLAAYVGDLNLYAISQKQSLALINEFDETDTLKIRYNISERLGKLLANSNPAEAMEYLPDAIANAEGVGNTPKEIELLAYMASCCRKTGKYFGEVECVDSVLEKVDLNNRLDVALLKTTKLNALLNIGNCGQIINMIDNEIMPVLDEYLQKKSKKVDLKSIYETWLKTCLILANALVLQGNDRAFEVLAILFEIIEHNQIDDELFICKCKLTLALANTMKGNFKASEQFLSETLTLYRKQVMDNETVIRWNFINIVNNFFKKQYNGMQEDLFRIVAFANNNGDNFTKNILKTLLGKIFHDNGNSKQAIEIFNEQISYFAKEKMALGALLTWVLISDATLVVDGAKNALDVAEQALKVAENPKINNFFFATLLRMVIAKCYITLSDFESAKMNIETAILTAKKFNMNDILSRLYILYGKYFQELGLEKSSMQMEYLTGAEKMYERASVLIHETRNRSVYTDLHKARKSLQTFCCVNNIRIE